MNHSPCAGQRFGGAPVHTGALSAMGKKPPIVSVAIPTYNRARWLRECVESALAQNYPELEVLVVDDGSTDDTTGIVKRVSDSRLRYIRKGHTGAPHTRNCAVLHARGDFILWLDSDDILLPHTVERELGILDKFREADIVYGDLQIIDEKGKNTGRVHRRKDFWGTDVISCVIEDSPVPHAGTMVRRSLYQEHGLYDERFARAHDYEFWSRIAESVRFKHAGCFTCKYRIHKSNLSGDMLYVKDTSYEIKIVRRLVSRYPLRRLFPALFQDDVDWGRCRAYLALASISLKWRDAEEAHSFLRKVLADFDRAGRVKHDSFRKELDNFLYRSHMIGSPYSLAEAMAAAKRFPSSFSFWRRLAMTAVPKTLRMPLERLKEKRQDREKEILCLTEPD